MTTCRSIFVLLTTLLLHGCDRSSADAPRLPTVDMPLGSRIFTLEVAATDVDRAKGLMDRDSMPVGRGMIFVFAEEAPRAFWMKSTRIALDIVYISAAGEVVDIKSMQPFDLRSTPSEKPAKYAIELNLGAVAACGVKKGDKLQIPPAAAEPKP